MAELIKVILPKFFEDEKDIFAKQWGCEVEIDENMADRDDFIVVMGKATDIIVSLPHPST